MTTEQLLMKWKTLDADKQAKVLAFIDSLKEDNKEGSSLEKKYKPQTELGKKLWNIRQKIIKNPDIKLLDLDEIEAELDEIRGKNK